jgi:alkylated DNA repair protein (DNA oxidative demethylase)
MLDLFDAPVLPGLASRSGMVDEAEERALVAAIDATDLTPFRFQGWMGRRLTSSFGFSYDFETQRAARANPIPDWLLPIRDRMAVFAGIEARSLIQALLIRYDPGAGIGWHRDRPIYEHVVGLSLGEPADMRFRRRRPDGGFDRVSLPSSHAGRITCPARPGTTGSIASSRWIGPDGRSPSAVRPQEAVPS